MLLTVHTGARLPGKLSGCLALVGPSKGGVLIHRSSPLVCLWNLSLHTPGLKFPLSGALTGFASLLFFVPLNSLDIATLS